MCTLIRNQCDKHEKEILGVVTGGYPLEEDENLI